MDFLVYLLYRAVTLVIAALPLKFVFRLGQGGGWLAYGLLRPYRRLANANLTIAYGGTRSAAEIQQLARRHFLTLGANLLCSIKAASFDAARLREVVEVEGMENILAAFAQRRGIVLAISHIGNWELFAQLCQYIPEEKWGTVYQPLNNRHIEAHIRRTRHKVALFARKNGFNAPTTFLREGGALGVLIDQHAGDGGVWTPLFGRLASTSTLAALLALRTRAEIIPMAVHTNGVGRWTVVISPPVAFGESEEAEALTARLNRVLESQINRSPADWFWVHNRWKTPKPRFLLARYKRGVVLPEGMAESELKPFRLLVRSANWLGDAVMSIPAVRSMAAGRPDARVTVLAPEKLADLWREVPGVAEVLPIPAGAGILGVAGIVRRAGPFDAAVLLPNSLRAALEAYFAKVPRRVGFLGHRRSWLLNQIVQEDTPPAETGGDPRRNQTYRYARLAEAVGAGEISVAAPAAAISQRNERGGWLRVGICPGAEYGPTKRWPAERFAEAAKLVSAERACEWTIFGVAKDAPYAETIQAALGERCENLVGKTTLAELIAALRGCDALLTNDTGTMHLAAWLGVPVAAVFGSTDPVLTAPLVPPERLRVLRRQVECSPCFLKECPLDLRCLHAVTPEEAAAAVLQLLPTSEASSLAVRSA